MPAMRGSHNDTIVRLAEALREAECELLYLINDISVDVAAPPGRAPVKRLELARHWLLAAANALSEEEAAELARVN